MTAFRPTASPRTLLGREPFPEAGMPSLSEATGETQRTEEPSLVSLSHVALSTEGEGVACGNAPLPSTGWESACKVEPMQRASGLLSRWSRSMSVCGLSPHLGEVHLLIPGLPQQLSWLPGLWHQKPSCLPMYHNSLHTELLGLWSPSRGIYRAFPALSLRLLGL